MTDDLNAYGRVTRSTPDIVILTDPISPDVLRVLVERFFEDMVKYVVDVERGTVALGGDLHSDAEALLLEDGSRHRNPLGGELLSWPRIR